MDKIDSSVGYFAGSKLNIGSGMAVGGTFDTSSAGTGTEIDYTDPTNSDNSIEVDLDIDLSVSGLVGTVSTDFNEFIGLTGGGGYYFGTVQCPVPLLPPGTIPGTSISTSPKART